MSSGGDGGLVSDDMGGGVEKGVAGGGGHDQLRCILGG